MWITGYIEMAGMAPEEFPGPAARPIGNRPQIDNLPHIEAEPQPNEIVAGCEDLQVW